MQAVPDPKSLSQSAFDGVAEPVSSSELPNSASSTESLESGCSQKIDSEPAFDFTEFLKTDTIPGLNVSPLVQLSLWEISDAFGILLHCIIRS